MNTAILLSLLALCTLILVVARYLTSVLDAQAVAIETLRADVFCVNAILVDLSADVQDIPVDTVDEFLARVFPAQSGNASDRAKALAAGETRLANMQDATRTEEGTR